MKRELSAQLADNSKECDHKWPIDGILLLCVKANKQAFSLKSDKTNQSSHTRTTTIVLPIVVVKAKARPKQLKHLSVVPQSINKDVIVAKALKKS